MTQECTCGDDARRGEVTVDLNPFRPTAGAEPPQLVGRAGLLDEFAYGLRIRSGAPGLLTIFTGSRGIGKTVMLSAAEDAALQEGWLVISDTATPGFLGRIGEAMRLHRDELGDGPTGRRITGVGIAGVSIRTELPPEEQIGWRRLGEQLLGLLEERGTGMLVTLDEVHAASRVEIAELAASVQHFIRRGLPIAFVCAGLPAAISDLLNEGVATFLRRADRIDLHAAAVDEVEQSYREVFADVEWVTPAQLRRAAEATGGYPFLIQLVGYHLWQAAEAAGDRLDDAGVDAAIEAARRRNARVVIDAALASASDLDRDFLDAMAVDDDVTAVADLAVRLEVSKSTVGNYRARLIDAGLVEPRGRGKLGFAIPGLREHLRARRR